MIFLRNETNEDYEWAITQLVKHLHTSQQTTWPAVIVTDNQAALTNAIDAKYPQQTTSRILCR